MQRPGSFLLFLSILVLSTGLVACGRDQATAPTRPQEDVNVTPQTAIGVTPVADSMTMTPAIATPSATATEAATAVPSPIEPSTAPEATTAANTVAGCQVRDEWPTYTVRAGDTLYSIARRAGSTVPEVAQANCLADPRRLAVGQVLHLPQAVAIAPTTAVTPVVVTTTPVGTPAGAPTGAASTWVRYRDPVLRVSFSYPQDWTPDEDSRLGAFAGDDGYVRLAVYHGPHRLRPTVEDVAHGDESSYSTAPNWEIVTLSNGQEAGLVLPSADQVAAGQGQAALVATLPQPVELDGTSYNYLILNADVDHIGTIAATVAMPPAPTAMDIRQFVVGVEEMGDGGKRLTFRWDSSGATAAVIYSGTAQRFAPWWPVAHTGEMTVELDGTIFPDPAMTLTIWNGVTGEELSQSVTVDWECEHDYFFTPAPERCPQPPLVRTGAYQAFERGFMIWRPPLENLSAFIFVFYQDGRARAYADEWTADQPVEDPELEPPAELYQPVRGFGKVWREQSGVRQDLGWATAPESAYELSYQAEIRESLPGVSYFTLPDGRLIRFAMTNWSYYPAQE